MASFRTLTRGLPGRVEVAVAPLGRGERQTLGGDSPAHGWSTTKVPVIVSLLRARGASGLTAHDQALAQTSIVESNNESILALFADLESLEGGLVGASAYLEETLRRGGAAGAVVPTAPPPPGAVTTFGQTKLTPTGSVAFFRSLALGCLLPRGQTGYLLGLMQRIEPSQSWGLGAAGFGSLAFKGGWGPEEHGYLVRQTGVIDPGSHRGAVVALVDFAPSFEAGTGALTEVARWLKAHVVLARRPRSGCP